MIQKLFKISYKINSLYYIIMETLKRFPNKNIFEVRGVKFYLPNKLDTINRALIVDKRFNEQRELNYISKFIHPGDLVLDIGANIGNHSLYFSQILGAKVIAFEPNKSICNILVSNAYINHANIIAHNCAVGNKNGRVNLFIGNYCKRNKGAVEVVESKAGSIKMIKLDDLNLKPKFIKIDIEGFESKAIDGMVKTLKSKPPILIEIKDKNLTEVLNKLYALGYKLDRKLFDDNYVFKMRGIHE